MNWHDILLERDFDETTLKEALAEAFDVPPQQVSIVNSIEEIQGGVAVVAERTPTKGDFHCLLSLYVEREFATKEPIQVTRRLCASLNVQALIPDSSLNPYSMILVSKAGEVRLVTLDAESLDLREEYRLSS